ncbi:MAG: alpha-amylase family glycosyl hydrolase [Bacteroidota bacterium]
MKKTIFAMIGAILTLAACSPKPTAEKSGPSPHVEWSRNATIYEVNIRQFTPEGTFTALEKELPRLQKMGVDILWLMPINPLGKKNRKGSLGSYYSVSDYYGVNPEYGTKADFINLVKKAHELGMKVIVDWVANHTAWDNTLIEKHPEWYSKDSAGNIIPPVADWKDVADLDYSQAGLRQYMTEALSYWIKEADIDGYRCDVAGMMPVDYWNEAAPVLRKIKPIFMLAEEEKPIMHDTAFDATYSWGIHHILNDIAKGKKSADKIDSAYKSEKSLYPADAYRMRFTSNHDENSWNGTEYERMGSGARAFAVFTFTFPGIPLVYSGQESAMNKRLRFFDKDTIPWGNYPLESFYTTLMQLKKKNDLIASGDSGGQLIKVPTSNDKLVYAFLRKKDNRKLFVLFNFSETDQSVQLKGNDFTGRYKEVFTGQSKEWKAGDKVAMGPWQYLVYENSSE